MNDPALYNKKNALVKRDVLMCLQEYGTKIKWKYSGERIIDIGSGDGSVTVDILTKFIPHNYEKIVGCDINEEMVRFSNENYSRDHIEFKLLDIEGQLPEMFRNSFDHAVSFFTFHWVKNQEKAFTNIYEMLTEGGGCLLIFGSNFNTYDVWRQLARTDKWRPWLGDAERYISPYQDSQVPEKEVEQIMKKIGFTNVDVVRKPMSFVFENVQNFKDAMTAVNPFKIPKNMFDDYLNDLVNGLRCINEANINNMGLINEALHYNLLIVSGNK